MPDRMQQLNSPDDVIKMFGGPTKAARRLNVTTNAVCLWRHRGIPPSCHMPILAEALRTGREVGPELFRMTDDDWEVLQERLMAPPKTNGSCK